MDERKLDLLCEGLGPTDTWLIYRDAAGKPGGKRRKQFTAHSFLDTKITSTPTYYLD
jgi:hypothetical protein